MTTKKTKTKTKWWEVGVQFECQGSGKCCTSHGEYGYVFFSKSDRIRAAKVLGITEREFRTKYCRKVEKAWALKDPPDQSPDCIFLENKRCSIYEGRPTQCRTWPFWPEVMGAKEWNKSVQNFCPGVGKGRTWSADEIRATLAEQITSEQEIHREIVESRK